MAIIYHVTTEAAWAEAVAQGFYVAPSLVAEGFIHCSTEGQVAGVLQRYFAGVPKLVKLVIDTEKLEHPLRYDKSLSLNEAFPHVYGPINITAVTAVESITAP